MIYSSALNEDNKNEIILSPKDIKENVTQAGLVISYALQEVLK